MSLGMTAMFHTLTVSLIKLAFGLAGFAFVFAGVAAIGPVLLLSAADPRLQVVRMFTLKVGAVCLAAGGALLWLRRGRLALLDEHAESPGKDDGPPFGGWLSLLALSLALTPMVLLPWLLPLGSLWRGTFQMLDQADFWGTVQRSPDFSGLAVLPVLAVLLVPLAEAATAASYGLASVLLLGLMAWRSRFFPRAFIMSLVVQAAFLMLVFVAVDLDLAGSVGRLFEPELSQMPGPEAAAVRNWLALHETVATQTALALACGFGAYLSWLPALLRSTRIESTFTRTPRWQPSFLTIRRDARLRPLSSIRWDDRVVTRIEVDGKTYSSLDEIPPETRARLGVGQPSAQGRRIYKSFEELPADIQARFPDLDLAPKATGEWAWLEERPKDRSADSRLEHPSGTVERGQPPFSRSYEIKMSGLPALALVLAVVTALLLSAATACQMLGQLL